MKIIRRNCYSVLICSVAILVFFCLSQHVSARGGGGGSYGGGGGGGGGSYEEEAAGLAAAEFMAAGLAAADIIAAGEAQALSSHCLLTLFPVILILLR
jgi:hypothetical protein